MNTTKEQTDFDTWSFNQCVVLGHKIKSVKDESGKNIYWINTTTNEVYEL